MGKLVSLVALGAGLWLLWMGYGRQHSLAGNTEHTLSTLGQKLDGGEHPTSYVKYYAAGTVLVLAGSFGLGLLRK
jgi:hypothetical protein